jgi:TolB protein
MELVTTARDGSDAKSIARLEIGYYYSTFRWSPDDRVIAFQRGIPNEHEILVVPASGGQPRQITRNRDVLEGLTWAADGSRIVFSSSGTSTIFYLPPTNLWSVDVDGSHPTQLTFGEASYTYPDINATGTIIAVRVRREFDIWRYPVDGAPDENVRRGVRITDQTSHVQTPSVAPDDSEVIYVSDSGGHANLWASDLATGESRQVTFERDPATRVGLPLWSPDGRHIAYFMTHGSSYNYFLMNADGSNSRLLAGGAAWATWSPDGDWLYFSSYPDGQYLKRAPVEGGSAQIIRDDHATRPAISPDGTTLYYVVEQPVVSGGSDLELRVARPEGAPSRVLVRIPASRTESWQQLQPVVSPDGNWLAFNLADGVASNLWAVSTATAELRQLTDFGEQPMIITRRASWSSDGRSIFASVGEAESDIVMFEGLSP